MRQVARILEDARDPGSGCCRSNTAPGPAGTAQYRVEDREVQVTRDVEPQMETVLAPEPLTQQTLF
jgi:hypothetical protein